MTTKKSRTRKAAAQELPLVVHATLTGLCIPVGNTFRQATRDEVLEAAAAYIVKEAGGKVLHNPTDALDIFRPVVCGREHETFAIAYLTTRHAVLGVEPMFRGTVDGAAVYPREIVKRALELNAAAVILAHNHPSGDCEPSEADRSITVRISKALAMVDIRLLDHLVLSNTAHTSLAERGWI